MSISCLAPHSPAPILTSYTYILGTSKSSTMFYNVASLFVLLPGLHSPSMNFCVDDLYLFFSANLIIIQMKLKSLLMKVKKESEKTALKLNI